jgi:hypothetical protein
MEIPECIGHATLACCSGALLLSLTLLIHPLSDLIIYGKSSCVTDCDIWLLNLSWHVLRLTPCLQAFVLFLSLFPRRSQMFSVPGPWFLRATLVLPQDLR